MFSIAADVRNTLGECPLWCERTRRLFWTDIEGSELLALEKDKNVVMRWSLPERLGSFALTEKADVLLMGLASRLGLYNLNTQVFSTVSASPGVSGTRIGDGRCDRSGNFLFGTMDDNHPPKVIGQFHRLNAATLTVETLSLPEVAIPNSICFSPDGGTMYYCDSMQGRIFCCDYPTLDNQRVFTETEGKGAPDGSCVDAMAIYGMQSGEEIVLYGIAQTVRSTAFCHPRVFRPPVRRWGARHLQRYIAPVPA